MWRDDLLPGAFRGIPFHVLSTTAQMGRRAIVHEFPLKENASTEDMGRKVRRHSLEALIIGPDYMKARNALIKALETPGPGTLTHPYLGIVQVQIEDVELRETTQEGGSARFQISCVEAAAVNQPAKSNDTKVALNASLKAAKGTIQAELVAVGTSPDDTSVLAAALGVPRLALNGVLVSALSVASYLSASLLILPAPELERLASLTTQHATYRSQGLQWFLSRSAVIVSIERIVVTTADEAQALLERLLRMLDALKAAEWQGQPVSDSFWDAVDTLQYALQRDIEQGITTLPRVQRVRVPTPLSALVLSYQLYATVARENEIVERNSIAHPGAVTGLVEILDV